MFRKFARKPSLDLLWLLALTLGCSFAWSQSTDDVQVAPRKHAGDLVALRGAPDSGAAVIYPSSKPFKAAVDLVLVPVVVTDARNQPVTTLRKQDFAVFEQGTPRDIQYFSMEQAPISIALLLDVSASMSGKVDAEQAAVAEFIKNANPEDEYYAITFSDRPRLLAESSRSADDIERKLLSAPRGGTTAMLDAIYLAEMKLRSARYKRRAIVIISDGGDNSSRYKLREIKKLVQESDVQIYAIGLFDSFFHSIEEKFGKRWLTSITDPTGGHTVTVDNEDKMPAAAAEISWLMRNQYVLGYHAARAASGWRKIKVRVTSSTAPQPLTMHYRKGYLAGEELAASQ